MELVTAAVGRRMDRMFALAPDPDGPSPERSIGESLREIRRMSWRNLSIGLGVIALACIGIVPISHRTRHLSSLSAGVRQLAGGDVRTRVPVRSNDEFGALAAAFNNMAADLERHQALVVEQERLRRELEWSRLIRTEMLPRAPLRLGTAEIKPWPGYSAIGSPVGYAASAVEIGRGDLLFIYTDGLVETENEHGEMFGAERLEELIERVHADGIDKVLEEVERAVRIFRGAAEPFDDATMMALRIQD